MTSVHCSQGHQNFPESRFCHLCGERLPLNIVEAVESSTILGLRYRIRCELGHGGFGRTYLAEDINRFNEPCVLKEFAPQAKGSYALQKAEELFEREAGILYQLQHPQIPRFRELFRAEFEDCDRLFLVQDYVEGQTYQQLLDARKQQGYCFSEVDVTQLLVQLLPVLQYLHNLGVIHRDISPDNIILRNIDQLPVLIDFGGVKQVSVAASQYVELNQAVVMPQTRLGKMGYAPDEQMQMGRAYPPSDLYALAVTVLVLLTGKEPQDLLDGTPDPNWRRMVSLSSTLMQLLERMLATNPIDRYQSAQDVLHALHGSVFTSDPITQPPGIYSPTASLITTTEADYTVTPTVAPTGVPAAFTPAKRQFWSSALFVMLILTGLGGAGWWTHDRWLPPLLTAFRQDAVEPDTVSTNMPIDEQARKAALQKRRADLGINYDVFITLTNVVFYKYYPEQAGRTLTDGEDDAEWRARWDTVANDLLTRLEANLSRDALSKLGRYTRADRDRWKKTINRLYVSSRALNDISDAKFFSLFPEQRDRDFIEQPIGQVWHAIAEDAVTAMQTNKILERIRFESGRYNKQISGTLQPGEGRIYIANLSEGQILRLNLQAPATATRLSIYLPRSTRSLPFLLEDAPKRTWSGQLPQSGFYEIVLVSTATEPIDYQLNVAVDRVTSTSVEPSEPEAPDAKE